VLDLCHPADNTWEEEKARNMVTAYLTALSQGGECFNSTFYNEANRWSMWCSFPRLLVVVTTPSVLSLLGLGLQLQL
jgi:hypothetical protein